LISRLYVDAAAGSGRVTHMAGFRQALDDMPIAMRYAFVGGAVLAIPGAIVGLIIGLNVHAPTAWAATFEVAIPAALLGALVGLAVGSVIKLSRR
jgi:hypothetical protein